MTDGYESVLNHLLFHKALISEEEKGNRIDHYLDMVRDIGKGLHLAISDPLERSIAAAFELVIENHFNPWDIDLVQFARMYLKKVKKEGSVNFITAGKLVLMAWSVLKMQSEEVLDGASPQEEFLFDDWDLDFTLLQDGQEADFVQSIKANEDVPLAVPVRRTAKRKVTLLELADAFEEARREAEMRIRSLRARRKASRKLIENFKEKVHKEDLSEDIRMTFERISEHDGEPVMLHDLYKEGVWDRVTVFVSVLFLAMMNRIRIWQESLPTGKIYVKIEDSGKELEGATASQIQKELEEKELAVVV